MHTEPTVEIAPRPDGRRRWRVGGKTYTEIPLPESDGDGPDSVTDADTAMLLADFKATITPLQRAALGGILRGIPAAECARDWGIDGSVARRRFTQVRRLFGKWLKAAGLVQD